jgi:hypothetical protein
MLAVMTQPGALKAGDKLIEPQRGTVWNVQRVGTGGVTLKRGVAEITVPMVELGDWEKAR